MAKFCGLIDYAGKLPVQHSLELMLAAMQHDPGSHVIAATFATGGLGVVHHDSHAPQLISADSQTLAWCGHIVPDDTRGPETDAARSPFGPCAGVQLAAALQTREPAGLRALNGTFGGALYDADTAALVVANDRYGLMPLYYYADRTTLLFASEVKALLRVLGERELDWEAVADFFYIGHLTGTKTLFRNIAAMEAGAVLHFDQTGLTCRRYHDFTATPVLSEQQVSPERLATLFRAAVRRRATPDHPQTVLLSGGYDSRLILGALHELGAQPRAVTLEHAGEADGADGRYAQQIAARLETACDVRPTRPHFHGSGDAVAAFYVLDGMAPTWELFIGEIYPELASGVGTVWDGLALDVALGGSHQTGRDLETELRAFTARRSRHRRLLRLILRPQVFRRMDRRFWRRLRMGVAQVPPSENQWLLYLLANRTRRRIAINPYQLFAARAEPITPAADAAFMEYVLGIPSRHKLDHQLYNTLLRQCFPQLIAVPLVSGGARVDLALGTQPPATSQSRARLRRALRPVLRPARLVAKSLLRRYLPGLPIRWEHADTTALIIRVLELSQFDRPCYNTRLLRRLFRAYRRGNLLYHRLFVLVLYIELWHLLFVDAASPLLFAPGALDRAAPPLRAGPITPARGGQRG